LATFVLKTGRILAWVKGGRKRKRKGDSSGVLAIGRRIKGGVHWGKSRGDLRLAWKETPKREGWDSKARVQVKRNGSICLNRMAGGRNEIAQAGRFRGVEGSGRTNEIAPALESPEGSNPRREWRGSTYFPGEKLRNREVLQLDYGGRQSMEH